MKTITNQNPIRNVVFLFILLTLLPLVFSFPPIPFLGKYFGAKVQLLEIAFAIIFPIWVISNIIRGNFRPHMPPGSLLFLAFVAVALVSSLISITPKRSLIDTAGFFYLFLLFFLFYNLIDKRHLILLSIRYLLFISLAVVLIGLVGFILYRNFGITNFAMDVFGIFLGVDLVRIKSTFFNGNYFVMFLGFSAVIALTILAIDEKRWVKDLALFLIALICIVLVCALYRGAFVVWGVLLFGAFHFKKTRLLAFIRTGLLVLFPTFFLLFAAQGYLNISPVQINHDPVRERVGVSLSTRPSVYANLHMVALELFVDNPIFGIGPANFNEYVDRPEYGFDFVHHPYRNLDPHSTYLGYLAETGLLGFLFVFSFLIRLGIAINKEKGRVDFVQRKYLAFFIPYFVLMLIYALFIDIITIRFLYFAYALAAVRLPQKEMTNDSEK